jgi:hypothetical protein
MKSLSIGAALMLAFLCVTLAPSPAGAFDLTGVGARIGNVDPDGAGDTFMAGGNLELEQNGTRLHLEPGLMVWSSDGIRDINPNVDLMYHFAPAGRTSPYVGAGLGMHFYSIDLPGPNDQSSDLGANFFGGVLVPMNSLRLFGEARYVATDRSQFMIAGGVTLPIGHP